MHLCTVQIEKNERFLETLRQPILASALDHFLFDHAARIGDEGTLVVVDRNRDPATHKPACASPDAERLDRGNRETSRCQVRLIRIEIAKRTLQRRVEARGV